MATSPRPDPTELGFRLLVDNIPGMVATMAATGEVEFVNRRILDYMGLTLDEIARSRFTLHENDRERVIALWNHSTATGAPYDVEHRIRAADGSYHWFHVRGVALRDAENRGRASARFS